MRKFNLSYLKQNPDADLKYINLNGVIQTVSFAFVFDQLVIKLTIQEYDYILQVDPILNDGSVVNLIDGVLMGKVFIDLKSELWGITYDAVIGSKNRELFIEIFNSKEDADFCIKSRLDPDFKPRAVLIESWDLNEEQEFLNYISKI